MSDHMTAECDHGFRVRQGEARPLGPRDPVPACSCPLCVLLALASSGGVTLAVVDVCRHMILPELAARIPMERQAVAERLRQEWESSTAAPFPSAALLAALAARLPAARKNPAPVADDPDPLPVQQARATSILDVCARLGVRMKLSGKRWRGSCPFHTSKRGTSFSVDPERGLWYCFSCATGGDTIDLLSRAEGLEFPAAVLELATYQGVRS